MVKTYTADRRFQRNHDEARCIFCERSQSQGNWPGDEHCSVRRAQPSVSSTRNDRLATNPNILVAFENQAAQNAQITQRNSAKILHRHGNDKSGCYDDFWAFDFLPGDAGGMNPVNLQLIPSIFLPFSNLIERHVMISPLDASSDKYRRTLECEIPVATAISVSLRSPCLLRYCRISFRGVFSECVCNIK